MENSITTLASGHPFIIILVYVIAPLITCIVTGVVAYQKTKANFKNEQCYAYHKVVFEELISKLYERLYNLDISNYNINKVVVLYDELNSLVSSNLTLSNSALDKLMLDLQHSITIQEGYNDAVNELKYYIIDENYRLKKYLGYPSAQFKDKFYIIMTPNQRMAYAFNISLIFTYIIFLAALIAALFVKAPLVTTILTVILFIFVLIDITFLCTWAVYRIKERIKAKRKLKKKMI